MLIAEEKVTRMTAKAVKRQTSQAALARDCILDFSNVATVDSSAVSVVLSWVRQLQAQGLTPTLVAVPQKLLDLAKLYGVLSLVEPFLQKK